MAKTRIAILGGGIGGLSAAFMLTDQEGWQERYEVTVYQLGWRLGGKGANGRNALMHERIEEHGLHVWFGFYENAFWLIRRCYDLLGSDWKEFFKGQHWITPMEKKRTGWVPWEFRFTPTRSLPGGVAGFPTPLIYARRLIRRIKKTCESSPGVPPSLQADGHLQAACDLLHRLPSAPTMHLASDYQAIVNELNAFENSFLQSIHLPTLDAVRRLVILVNLGVSALRGMLRDGVLNQGFDVIDAFDFREWLRKHGAFRSAVWSAVVRALYAGVFAYLDGNTRRPNLAAGTALRGALRMIFSYKGAFLWKMQAGMGETVFTPLYQVLKARGVNFQFFHKVERLHIDGAHSIAAVDVTIQATTKTGRTYRPLRKMKDGLDCWPTVPLYDQLNEGDRLQSDPHYNLESAWSTWPGVRQCQLRRGTEFDQVVLAIPVGALGPICADLADHSPQWRNMLRRMRTVQTVGMQLWLQRDTGDLGWSGRLPALATSYVEPFDTWADMTQLIEHEDWPGAAGVRNISYFCGPFTDAPTIPAPGTSPDFPGQERARALAAALHFLQTATRSLWPMATDPRAPDGLDWALLVAEPGQVGPQRLQSQFCTANIDPSARYVLSVKGSTPYRLAANHSWFDNLVLAGDWTRNGLNCGCVESAVMSGMQAARALCGHPHPIAGESDFQ